MSPTHPHGPHRTHPHHPRPSHARAHERGHHHHPHRPPQRRRSRGYWSDVRQTFADIGRVLFRTRYGNLSKAKIISFGIVFVGVAYVLLVRGFFPFDIASPWIESALERQLGPGHKVSIGSTKLEHDETGAPVLRVEQIRVHGPNGKVIANAPSAEVGLDGTSLLVGSFRARSIDLVGAETVVHLGSDGRIAITAGRDATPITAVGVPKAAAEISAADQGAGAVTRPSPQARTRPVEPSVRAEPFHYPELVRWLDGFEKSGLDGVALSRIGLKQGSLVVEDADTGRRWSFDDINIQLSRPTEGGLLFALSSSRADERWSLTATVAPLHENARNIDIVASNIAAEDIILAAGGADLDFMTENALSGILRAQVAADGRLLAANFRASANGGVVGSVKDPEARFRVDELQIQARFDPQRRATIIEPFMIQAGANRLAFSAVVEAPKGDDRQWAVTVPQGIVFLSTGREGDAPLVLDQVSARGVFDAIQQRLIIQQGTLAGASTGGAFSGSLTFGTKPTLALGVAASQVPTSAAKRLWPALVARNTRAWAVDRIEAGILDRILIALNVPLDAIGKPGVELPDSAVRMEFTASNAAFRPKENTPLIRDAQVTGMITGKTARVRIAKAVIESPQGRRLSLTDGVLDVPDHVPQNPNGSIRFRFDGPADAVAEMAAADYMRDTTGFTVDAASARGSVSANVQIDLVFRADMTKEDINYSAEADVKDFAADAAIKGQRVEGVNAKVFVNRAELAAKGSGRVAGAMTAFEYRNLKEKQESEFRATATLDDNTRSRIGMDLAPWLTGPVPTQIHGRVTDREKRFDVEADLSAAKVADLVPGWQKPAGRAAKASFKAIERDSSLRLEDLSVTGSGTTLKGSLELDGDGSFVAANLPVFHLSDGDKASLRAERAPDGALRVTVRGDVLDARGALRGLTEGPAESAPGKQHRARDLDLELRLGAATGHNGEVARQLELRVVRRNGDIRSFSLLGKIGRDASIVGEMRARDGGRPVVFVTSGDAGAMFRFADFYSRIYGGEASIMIEPPSGDGTPQEGRINLRDFTIRGEPALDRMQSAAPVDPNAQGASRPVASQGVPFLRMQVDFNRTPGRFNIREAVIYGPTIGATVDGVLDFAANRVHLRGTYIPAFGLNNLFGQLPIVGLFLGGPKEGLIAITFEVVGPTSGPTLRVNPMSAAAPGFLRKLFEFRGVTDTPAASEPPVQQR